MVVYQFNFIKILKVESDERPLTFGEVVIRVSPKFSLAMHIDTDDANSTLLKNGDKVKILKRN